MANGTLQQAEKVYRLYLADPERGGSSYLHDHFRRGEAGIMEPDRRAVLAHAAWRAGRDRAATLASDYPPEIRGAGQKGRDRSMIGLLGETLASFEGDQNKWFSRKYWGGVPFPRFAGVWSGLFFPHGVPTHPRQSVGAASAEWTLG